ncbi:MAG: leucine-rich repeat domain-containing protein, partial [Paramuribaculum sp.]|nr:leucine-rich repeat domain-containing protein [Paramuribaculum sp.]
MYLRIIIIFLSIFATILPANALATFTDGDFRFRTINENECEVIGSSTPPNPLVIPATATYNGMFFTVTRIGTSAFKDNIGSYKIADKYQYNGELVIPNTIVSIGDSAFMGCKGLTGNLKLPDGLKIIGNYAFAACGSCIYDRGLKPIDDNLLFPWYSIDLTSSQFGFKGSLLIPESVVTIGDGAFCGTDFTGDLIIPDSVKEIGGIAFAITKFNGSLKLSNSITKINSQIISGLSIKGDLRIPDSVTTIESNGLNLNFTGELILSNSLTYIGKYAFSWNSPKYLHLPNSLQYIGEGAFRYAQVIGELQLPTSLKHIDKYGFLGCEFDGDLVLPDSLVSIGDEAFSGCKFGGKLILSKSLKTIGDRAFANCDFFCELILPESLVIIGASPFVKRNKPISFFGDELIIPDSVTTIGAGAFSEFTFSKLILGKSVEIIGGSAFRSCANLTGHLELPNSVKSIGSYAFLGTGITGVTFNKSLQHLGDSPFPPDIFSGVLTLPASLRTIDATFVDSPGITEVIFQPNSQIESIGAAFRYCTGLTKVTMNGSVNPFTLRGTFNNCTNLTHIRLGGTLSKIDIPTGIYDQINTKNKAFYGCDNIRNIVFENGNEPLKLDSDIFADCAIDSLYLGRTIDSSSQPFKNQSTIKALTLGGSVNTVNDGDFAGCTGLKSLVLEYNGYGLPITLGSNGNGKGAFADCPIDSLHLGRTISASSFPDQFKDMTSLTKLTFGPSVLKIPESIFSGCSGISSLAIPKSVSTIGKNAFAGCTGIKTLKFEDGYASISTSPYLQINPQTLTLDITDDGRSPFADSPIDSLYIGVNLNYSVSPFKGSSTLKSVKFGEFVGKISDDCFDGCSALTDIEFPVIDRTAGYKNDRIIGRKAFANCTKLKGALSIPTVITAVEDSAFINCSGITKINIEGNKDAKTLPFGKGAFAGTPANTVSVSRNTTGSPFAGNASLNDLTIGEMVTAL